MKEWDCIWGDDYSVACVECITWFALYLWLEASALNYEEACNWLLRAAFY